MGIAEAIMAISVITIGLLRVSSLVIQNTKVRGVNRNQLIASMLAQEGLELTRNLRDKNWLNRIADPSLDWDDWITDGSVPNTFTVDYESDTTVAHQPDHSVSSINDNGTRLYVNGNGFYTHNSAGGTLTKFRRLISAVDNGDHLLVSATVSWASGTYVAETYLYDWR